VVRVNPQGEMVIAGRAAPGAEVKVLDGDRVVGTVTADANGEWVLLPSQPLSPGNHELSLTSRSPSDGATSKSDGVVALLVPERSQPGAAAPGSVAVLVPRNGKGPVRSLQAPSDATGHHKLALDVIEYDSSGNVQLLGRAEPNTRVEVYLDDHLLGSSVTDGVGGWSITLNEKVPVGRHSLRLEALGSDGRPVGELALNFNRIVPLEGFAAVDVQPGNNLWRIAQHSYGDGLRYAEIYQVNRDHIRDPDLIYPGQIITVPAKR
jgi:nucleoid-associated protein YgaU